MGTSLDTVNDAFHEAYDLAHERELAGVPVLVVLADDLVLFRRGWRRDFAVTPRAFHVIKSTAHVPVAVFVALLRRDEPDALRELRHRIVSALASLSTEPVTDESLSAAIRTVLAESLHFVDRALVSSDGPTSEEIAAFARVSGRRLLELTRLATTAQLAALHAVVEKLLAELTPEERGELQVVVTGNHQARVRSLGMQYFRKRMREADGVEDRVAYAEGVETAEEALALVGTRRVDAQIAKAFFGDARRLQQDVLGDAVRGLLAETELSPIE